ncbi:hypothetical protein DBV15_04240 [Temnothorax longispinosus]|uniref:Uncharacterized protein n=1 Tax=Temnothorax longispinosus TaxID=300112 RepID=A0A4S2KRB8_9HYME|nr:hypothetical protein DBV15_04240 [Temnothorax longispinosus]
MLISEFMIEPGSRIPPLHSSEDSFLILRGRRAGAAARRSLVDGDVRKKSRHLNVGLALAQESYKSADYNGGTIRKGQA